MRILEFSVIGSLTLVASRPQSFKSPRGIAAGPPPPPEHCVVETLGARVWWHLAESESPQHLCGAGSVTLVSGGNRLREGEKLPGITSWLYRSGDGALVG